MKHFLLCIVLTIMISCTGSTPVIINQKSPSLPKNNGSSDIPKSWQYLKMSGFPIEIPFPADTGIEGDPNGDLFISNRTDKPVEHFALSINRTGSKDDILKTINAGCDVYPVYHARHTIEVLTEVQGHEMIKMQRMCQKYSSYYLFIDGHSIDIEENPDITLEAEKIIDLAVRNLRFTDSSSSNSQQ